MCTNLGAHARWSYIISRVRAGMQSSAGFCKMPSRTRGAGKASGKPGTMSESLARIQLQDNAQPESDDTLGTQEVRLGEKCL